MIRCVLASFSVVAHIASRTSDTILGPFHTSPARLAWLSPLRCCGSSRQIESIAIHTVPPLRLEIGADAICSQNCSPRQLLTSQVDDAPDSVPNGLPANRTLCRKRAYCRVADQPGFVSSGTRELDSSLSGKSAMAPNLTKVETYRQTGLGMRACNFRDEVLRPLFHGK